MKPTSIYVIFLCIQLFFSEVKAQAIPANSVISTDELYGYLNKTTQAKLKDKDKSSLARYFRERFSECFFYDYKTFYDRLTRYTNLYKNQNNHKRRALDHMGKFADSTQWLLPFNYLNGEPVNAYALRHLARQHKMVDMAFLYFNEGKDPKYIRYFEKQMRSLNAALAADAYEKIEDGNGVYEAFRAGYRVLNWLWIHNMFLNESEYSDEDQLITIATLLQHGQYLYERNAQFKSGNHQTRGVSALAMLSILFRDFEGTDKWYERAMQRLGEHLDKEINDDGFQFERSIHYHMSDINNYFYVYQLAKINKIEVGKVWEEKLRGLFTTLVKVASPDRSAPVLQDDTDKPWAEKNDISGAMTLGYLLFKDPEFGYFASDKVDSRAYWFLTNVQLNMLDDIKSKKPTYGSLSFDDTGYYIMREGWNKKDKMMIISAGVDNLKPDHQHGDILGIQAVANGHVILPNYQVRYSLKDFKFFKNSMVKNVALVDDELLGKEWTGNKGGSGFGKFRKLPNPEVIAWQVNNDFDFFAGSHDGFNNVGVGYTRQVIFVKDEFWIVKDNFKSDSAHEYKQVWQGHYTTENGPNLLRATASDASGHDILQLIKTDSVRSDGKRGKQWSVVSKSDQKDFSFITIIYPFRGYNHRIDEDEEEINMNDWVVNNIVGGNSISMRAGTKSFLFNTKIWNSEELTLQTTEEADLFIKKNGGKTSIYSISDKNQTITLIQKDKKTKLTRTLEPGQIWEVDFTK